MIGGSSLYCLQDDDDDKTGHHVFTNCTAKILRHRPIKNIREELIQSSIQIHHDTYVCSVKTLHFMITSWLDGAHKLVQQGIPVVDVCESLYDGVHECIKNLKNLVIQVNLENCHPSDRCDGLPARLPSPFDTLPSPPAFTDIPPPDLPAPTEFLPPPPNDSFLPPPYEEIAPDSFLPPPPSEDFLAPDPLLPLPPPPLTEELSAPDFLPHPNARRASSAIKNTKSTSNGNKAPKNDDKDEDYSSDDDDDDKFVSCIDLTVLKSGAIGGTSGDVRYSLRNIEKQINSNGDGTSPDYEDEFDACFEEGDNKKPPSSAKLLGLSVGRKVFDDDVFLENNRSSKSGNRRADSLVKAATREIESINDFIKGKLNAKRPMSGANMSRHFRSVDTAPSADRNQRSSDQSEHVVYTLSDKKFVAKNDQFVPTLRSSKSSPNMASKTPELTRRRLQPDVKRSDSMKSSKSLNHDSGHVEGNYVDFRSKSLAMLNIDVDSIEGKPFSNVFSKICESLTDDIKKRSLKLENQIVKVHKRFAPEFESWFESTIKFLTAVDENAVAKCERSSQSFTDDMDGFRRQGAIDVEKIYGSFLERLNERSVESRVKVKECIGDYTDELWEKLAETYQFVDTSIESLCLSLRHVISEHTSKKRKHLDVLIKAINDEQTDIFETSKPLIDKYQSSLLENMYMTFEILKDEVDLRAETLSKYLEDKSLLGKIFKQRSSLYDYISEAMGSMSHIIQEHCNALKKLLELFFDSALHKIEKIVVVINKCLDDSSDLCTSQVRDMFRLLTMKSYQIHGETIGIVTRNKRVLYDNLIDLSRLVSMADRQCKSLVQIINVDSQSLLVHWEENRSSFVVISSEAFHQLIRNFNEQRTLLNQAITDTGDWFWAEFHDSIGQVSENLDKYGRKLIENVSMHCQNFFEPGSIPIPTKFDPIFAGDRSTIDVDSSRDYNRRREKDTSFDLRKVIGGLTRNCEDVTDLLMASYQKQRSMFPGKSTFDVSRVHCYCLEGPLTMKPAVIDGIILPASTDVISIIQKTTSTEYNVLLIAGDLKSTWMHTGYKESVQSSTIVDKAAGVDRETWIDQCLLTMKNLNVTCVLVQGEVDLNLLLALNSNNFAIPVIHHVPYKVLKMITMSTKTELTSYIRNTNKSNVATGIKMTVWRGDWMDTNSIVPYVIIDCGHPTWTAVSCHPSSAILQQKEEQFHHGAHRLQYALTSGTVLPGAGVTEKHSIQLLKTMNDQSEKCYKTAVYEMMIEVFEKFIYEIGRNSEYATDGNRATDGKRIETFDGSVVFYDDAVTKAAVWRTAANVVSTLLFTDMEIITGLDDFQLKQL